METTIAFCGLNCDTCPIHLATLELDKSQQQKMRESIAEKCYLVYGMVLKPEEFSDCDGCRSDTGILFSGCMDCKIRKCASGNGLDSCAYCDKYPCMNLQTHFSLDPDAQIRLEEIRQMKGI